MLCTPKSPVFPFFFVVQSGSQSTVTLNRLGLDVLYPWVPWVPVVYIFFFVIANKGSNNQIKSINQC